MGGAVGEGVDRMVQIDFLVVVLRQEGTRRVRMGSFQLLGVLLIYILSLESCDSYMMTLPVMCLFIYVCLIISKVM